MRPLLLLGGLVVLVAACGPGPAALPTATSLLAEATPPAAAPAADPAVPTATLAPVINFDPTDPEIVFGDRGNAVSLFQDPATMLSVATLAGNGEVGFADGPANEARFNSPTDVTLDGAGNIYVADLGNHSLRQITDYSQVLTLAGNGEPGYVDGPGPEARFWFPQAAVVDASGVIYVADSGNGVIRIVKRVITP